MVFDGPVEGLLPGEDPDVRDPVEIQHWITLYEQRREIWRRRLRRARDVEARMRLQRTIQWAEARLAYWRNRHARFAGIAVEPVSRRLTGRTGTVALTRREYQLLSHFADHPGQHIPPSLLVSRAWPDADLCEEQLRTYMVRLRRKMGVAGAPCRIVAERTHGYALVFDDDPSGSSPS